MICGDDAAHKNINQSLADLAVQFDSAAVEDAADSEPESNDGDEVKYDRPLFNASFLYHLRQQFADLFPKSTEDPGTFQSLQLDSVEGENVLVQLAHSEFRRRMSRRERQKHTPESTKPKIEEFVGLSSRWYRDSAGGPERPQIKCDDDVFAFDGWRVARFLNQLQQEEMPDHD